MGRRESILDAAADLIVRWGLKKTTIEDIAQACGLERASVYYYFKNKEEILAEVVRREVDRQSAILFEAQNREPGAPAKLRALFRAHLDAFATSPLAAIQSDGDRTNLFHIFPQAFRFLEARRHKLVDLIADIVTLGVRTGELRDVEPRDVAEGIRTLFLGHTIAFLLNDAPSDAAIGQTFDALVRGIECKPG